MARQLRTVDRLQDDAPRKVRPGVVTLVLDVSIPSLNALLRQFSNRHAYKGLRLSMAWAVRAAVLEARARGVRIDTPPASKRAVRIVRVLSSRNKPMDADNLCGGSKPLVDSLVDEQLIVDDSLAHVEVTYEQVRGVIACTRIEISAADTLDDATERAIDELERAGA